MAQTDVTDAEVVVTRDRAIMTRARWERVERELREARDALAFYADDASWRSPDPSDPDMAGAAEMDLGDRARAALSPSTSGDER